VSGDADLGDPALKERVANLKAIRDQAQADANRTAAMLESSGRAITPQMVRRCARMARERIKIDGGGYRRGSGRQWGSTDMAPTGQNRHS